MSDLATVYEYISKSPPPLDVSNGSSVDVEDAPYGSISVESMDKRVVASSLNDLIGLVEAIEHKPMGILEKKHISELTEYQIDPLKAESLEPVAETVALDGCDSDQGVVSHSLNNKSQDDVVDDFFSNNAFDQFNNNTNLITNWNPFESTAQQSEDFASDWSNFDKCPALNAVGNELFQMADNKFGTSAEPKVSKN
jgi:hypothetical protein